MNPNHSDLETRLAQLGENWPVASVADAVAKRVESIPLAQRDMPRSRSWQFTFAGSVAVLVAFAFVWATMLSSPATVSAQVQAAMKKARSAHVSMTIIESPDRRQKAELWYSREHGFRAESPEEFIVDNGQQQWAWNPALKESDLIVARRTSRNAAELVANSMQLGAAPADWSKGRMAELDRDIQGKRCEAHLIVPPANAEARAFGDASPTPLRFVVWLDPQQRVTRIEEQRQANAAWQTRRETSIEYDVEITVDKFAVKFPAAAKIMDADGLWAARFPLEKSLATAESGGLLFAVHEVTRCDKDMFYIVSSVRGTPEHLKRFPPQRRRLNLQTTILDVAEQLSGVRVDRECHHAMLTSAENEGVHYVWSLAVPRNYFQLKDGVRVPHGTGTKLEFEPGRIHVPLAAHYRDRRAGNDLVQVDVDVTLRNDGAAETLLQIAGRARRDALLNGEGLNLYGDIKNNEVRFLRPASVTDAEFASGLRSQIEWLQSNDQVSDGFVMAGAAGKVPDVAVPVRLPAKITGQVVDQADKPVAKASVTIRIRRFDPYVDPTDAAAPPAWTATTDDQGRYTITTDEPMLGKVDELRIKIKAEGFADLSTVDYERKVGQGELPTQRLHAGRKVQGRLVDPQGQPVAEASVRFQADSTELKLLWDSGPVPVDSHGAFAVTIPKGCKAAVAIYPRQFAAQPIEVPQDTGESWQIPVSAGTSVTGRVLDRQGKGIAGTVVAIESDEHVQLPVMRVLIALAVKTDEAGRFTLPPMLGKCKVWVTDNAPDYSRQFMVTGTKPPAIRPQTVELNGKAATKEVNFRAD